MVLSFVDLLLFPLLLLTAILMLRVERSSSLPGLKLTSAQTPRDGGTKRIQVM